MGEYLQEQYFLAEEKKQMNDYLKYLITKHRMMKPLKDLSKCIEELNIDDKQKNLLREKISDLCSCLVKNLY